MKTKLFAIICTVCLSWGCIASAHTVRYDPVAVAADALVARPVSFAATIIGSAVFVIALPVAATSGSINSTADALVKQPAWFTFRRPLGDFDYTEEYANKWPGKQEPRRITHSTKRLKAPKT